jgi:hypothetical protein
MIYIFNSIGIAGIILFPSLVDSIFQLCRLIPQHQMPPANPKTAPIASSLTITVFGFCINYGRAVLVYNPTYSNKFLDLSLKLLMKEYSF